MLELAHKELDEILALLLRADDGTDLRFYIDAHDVQRRRGRFELDAEPRTLLEHLRLLKRHFVERRRNDAVARFRDLGERSRHLVVCALGFYEIADRRH